MNANVYAMPRKVKLLICSFSINNLVIGYLLVYLTAFLPQIGFRASEVGTLIGLQGIIMILAGVPIGILSDRKGRKWILILATIGIAPGTLVFALTDSYFLYILASVVFGLVEAASITTWNAIISDLTDIRNRTAAFSFSFILSTILSSIGYAVPLSFPTLERLFRLETVSLHKTFLALFGIMNLATPIALTLILRDFKEVINERDRIIPKNIGVLTKLSLVNGLIGFGAGVIIPLIPTWFYLRFGVRDTFSGPVLALSGITIGLAAIVSPYLSQRFGIVKSIVFTTGSSVMFMISLALVPIVELAAIIYIIRAALMNMANPLFDSFMMSIVAPEERGIASALNSIVWRLPESFSTVIGGLILQANVFDLPFYIAATFYIAGISSFYLIFNDSHGKS